MNGDNRFVFLQCTRLILSLRSLEHGVTRCINSPGCQESEDFASSNACLHPRNTNLKDFSSLVDVAVIGHHVLSRDFQRRKFGDLMRMTAMGQSHMNASGCRRASAMAECKASDELDWSLAWRAYAHSSVRPAGSVAMVNCTLLDRSDRSSKAAGWTLGRDSWLHSFGA